MAAKRKHRRAKRLRAAKANGSVGTLQRTIERTFNLPGGCIRIIRPSGRKMDADLKVQRLREVWDLA